MINIKQFVAVIPKNSNREAVSDNGIKIRVRIPDIHGFKSESGDTQNNSSIYVEDTDLPFANIVKPITSSGEFTVDSHFKEGELVLVQALNDDMNNLLITGKLGNYTATTDPQIANSRVGNSYSSGAFVVDGDLMPPFSDASSLVSVAKSQINEKDDGNNKCIYNDELWGEGTCGDGYAWCCAFVWWCFKHTNPSLSKYYYGGGKTALCETLRNYHKNAGDAINSNFKAGDIVFFNWNGGTNAQHVGIVIEDQKDNSVKTIEGNTQGSGNQSTGGHVMEKTRTTQFILDGFRPGKSTSNEEQCFMYFTQTMGLSVAAACGILGNIFYESSFRTTALGDSGTSYGICQWHNSRYTNLMNWCNQNEHDYTSLSGQLEYLEFELTNGYKSSTYEPIRKVSNSADGAADAAEIWCRNFERPANVDYEVSDKRRPKAIEYYNKYINNN